MDSTTPKLYRVSEVVKLLSVSRATVYRLVADGKLKLIKIGRHSSRITADSVNELASRGYNGEASVGPSRDEKKR